ncbi:F-box domain-containing protein [Phyllosticta citribraziliensis]|uniref:F-box domain-containing protein n=1 Tax=Phyllosticta citribraziliensis TaxID=989973 RepID=A0ABR1LFQ7_9PEZI
MAKRTADALSEVGSPPRKRTRGSSDTDRLSQLSDETLLRILSYLPIPSLNACQRVSKRFHAIACDSQLWKAAYYNRFVRPRASRLPGIKEVNTAGHLYFSSRISKWLDEASLVENGKETNWKRQYKLRHNWSRGTCDVAEIPLLETPSTSPILVHFHDGIIYTADLESGLRAWSAGKGRNLIASIALDPQQPAPTCLTVDDKEHSSGSTDVVIGFGDGSFSIYSLSRTIRQFWRPYSHPASSNGIVSAVACAWPYLLTMNGMQLMSLYKFPRRRNEESGHEVLDPPRLLYSLRSHTVWPPLSLSIRPSSEDLVASIAYALPTYLSGWTVGIQEMRITSEGKLVDSRLASAENSGFQSLSKRPFNSPSDESSRYVTSKSAATYSKPLSLSYTHPYLLSSHPDNTLTLYMVKSTKDSLSIGPGTRLWGHTSSVSGVHVAARGKAVSVSSRGDEIRVWELEGGMGSSSNRRRQPAGELSIRIQPDQKQPSSYELSATDHAAPDVSTSLAMALRRADEWTRTGDWVGFDEENVIVLREWGQGNQALVVYDFT